MKNSGNQLVWIVGVLISIGILTTAVIIFVRKVRSVINSKNSKNVPPLNILIIGVFFSLFELFVLYNYQNENNIFNAVFVSCFNSIRVFLANEDITILHDATSRIPEFANICGVYISFLYAFAPILLIGFILSFLEDVISKIKYLFLGHRDLYIFSCVNERSIILAENIRNTSDKKSLIVFADVVNRNDPDTYKYIQRAEAAGAICLKSDIEDIYISAKYKKRKVCLLLLDEDETSNLKKGIALIEKYRNRIPANIYISAVKTEAEIMLDSIPKGDIEEKQVQVRRINDVRSMVYDIFDKRPLFINTKDRKISILIVGAGSIGFETFKAALWFGQIVDYELFISVVDRQENIKKKFEKEFPGVFENNQDTLNRTSIEFVTEDVNQSGFTEFLKKHPDTSYVVVALGDDDLNIKTAIDIRSFYADTHYENKSGEIENIYPLINVVIEDTYKSSTVKILKNVQGSAYNILPFGEPKELYRSEKIIEPYTECLARQLHSTYGSSIKSFNDSEYNRNSSISSALHLKYKLFWLLKDVEGIDWSGKPSEKMLKLYTERLTEQTVEKLAIMEHYRWNAYMYAEGFVRAGYDDTEKYCRTIGMHYNVLTKKHPCLAAWDELDEISEAVGKIKNGSIDYKYYDRFIVQKLPEIYEMAAADSKN